MAIPFELKRLLYQKKKATGVTGFSLVDDKIIIKIQDKIIE